MDGKEADVLHMWSVQDSKTTASPSETLRERRDKNLRSGEGPCLVTAGDGPPHLHLGKITTPPDGG